MGKFNINARISGFLAALVAGLIFLYSGITGLPFFGQKYLSMVIEYFPALDPSIQVVVAGYLNVMGTIADFTGLVVLVAAVLILMRKGKLANIILLFTIAVGVFGFLSPVVTALFQGGQALGIALDSLASKYVIGILLVMVAKKNAENV